MDDSINDDLLTSVPVRSSIPEDLCREVNLAVNRSETVEHRLESNSQQSVDRREEPEYDPRLSELIGSVRLNGADPENRTKRLQVSEGTGIKNGILKSESAELNHRIGARRRKSGSVKRFKQEVVSREADVENVSCEAQEQGIEIHDNLRVNLIPTKSDSSKISPVIVRIIKPIGFSSSGTNNDPNVSVTFVVKRFVIYFTIFLGF